MSGKNYKLVQAERFGGKYEFLYEEYLNELDNIEINFYAELLALFEKSPQEFLELIANRKKQKSRLLKIKSITNRKMNLREKREHVQTFFEKVPVAQYLSDVSLLSDIIDYEVVDQVAEYRIGKSDDEGNFTPYKEEDLQEDKLIVQFADKEVRVSVQSIIYFICVNEMTHEQDKDRLKECECEEPDAIFAFTYVEQLLNDCCIPLLLMKQVHPISALLLSTVIYTKAIRYLKDIIDLKNDGEEENALFEMNTQLDALKLKKSTDQATSYANYLAQKVGKLEEREAAQVKKRKELQDKLEKQKEKLDVQMEKTKLLKQELDAKGQVAVENTEAEKLFHEELVQIKQQLKIEKDERKDLTKTHQKELKNIEDKLEKELEENKRLVNDVSLLQSQLAQEKRLKLQSEELTFEKWLEEGPKLLLTMTEEQEGQLKDFLTIAENVLVEGSLERPKMSLASNRIGYCHVRTDGHFVNFGDGHLHELKPFSDNIYLSDTQFVEVTKDLELIRPLKYYYEVGPAEYAIAHFAIVEERHDKAFAKINGQTIQVKYKGNAYIVDGQVISVNKNNELISYYKNRSNTLEDILPSIQLKGHQPLYVTMALANGYVTRTLNGLESFQPLEESLLMHSMIVVNAQNEITLTDPTGQMYKRSSLYKHKQLASVSELEEATFVLKQNQEYVQLHDVPSKVELDLGDMVWVDEFNRFIERVQEKEEIVSTETIEQKLLNSGRKVTRKSTMKPKVEKNKDLLIIGNIRISERYKKYFGEYGYEVEVVDGTGPFEKISQACSKFDNILYSTAFTSHRNSGKMSKEVKKQYILCDSTAPRVLHYALEQSV